MSKLIFCLLVSSLIWTNSGCDKKSDKLSSKTETEICKEHNVPEAECTKCNPSLIPAFKSKGDWCTEHNLPESQCVVCNPVLAGTKTDKAEEHTEDKNEHEGKKVITNGIPSDVKISEESQELMGIKLTKVSYRKMEETLQVSGEIAKDTEKLYHILPKTSGEVLDVKILIGDIVQKGQVLAVIRSGNTNVDVVSEWSGIIVGKNIIKGTHIDELTSLFTVADMSKIESNFDIREKDIGKIKFGQKIKVKTISYPEKSFIGKIIFISPEVNNVSRTVKVRAGLDNDEYLLKFNMFVTGNIILKEENFIAIPSKTILKNEDNEIVFVSKEKNEFSVRKVEIGFQSGEFSQVIRGLSIGEKIVSEGQFLLKSELLKSKMGAGCAD